MASLEAIIRNTVYEREERHARRINTIAGKNLVVANQPRLVKANRRRRHQ